MYSCSVPGHRLCIISLKKKSTLRVIKQLKLLYFCEHVLFLGNILITKQLFVLSAYFEKFGHTAFRTWTSGTTACACAATRKQMRPVSKTALGGRGHGNESGTERVFEHLAASNAQGLSVCRVNIQFVFISDEKKRRSARSRVQPAYPNASSVTMQIYHVRLLLFTITVIHIYIYILTVNTFGRRTVNAVRIKKIRTLTNFPPSPYSQYRSVSYTFVNIAFGFYIISHIFPRLKYAQHNVLKRIYLNRTIILKYFFPSHRRFPRKFPIPVVDR